MLNIAFGQSKYYIDNLSENIKRGHRQKLRKGIWPGFAPLGYLNNHKTKAIDTDKDKAPIIRKCFELYSTGEYTLKAIKTVFGGYWNRKLQRQCSFLFLCPANVEKSFLLRHFQIQW